jgi:hypothetical protein
MFQSLKDIAQKAGFIGEFSLKNDAFFKIDLGFIGNKHFIRFSSLLEFLEKTQLIYTKQNDPLINFDYEIGKSYMITNKWVISPNPNILLINPGTVSLSDELRNLKITYGVTNLKEGDLLGALEKLIQFDITGFEQNNTTTFNILDSLPEFKRADDGFNSEIGDIMNIYLEVDKVFDIFLENLDEKTGAVSIFKFLDSICSVINSTLGNLSSIAPFIDESTNTLSIIEEGELPHKDKLLTNTINVPLQLYGYSNINTTNPTSSFVKSFNLKTEITNDLATMVTIGAQASGEIVKGIDATAFASWNRGLIDRIIPIKKPDTETVTEKKTDEEKKGDLLKKYETGLGNYVSMLDAYSAKPPKFEEDDISSFTSGLKTIIDYNKELIKLEKETKNSGKTIGVTQPGFLPINLNLTLDGISGPTILRQFEAEGRFLPHPIPDTLTFLIKGLNHKISNNVWTTTIDSLSVPKFVKSSTTTTTSNTTTSKSSPAEQFSGPTPNADRLRATLKQLNYQEKGSEISNGGDITSNITNLAISVFNQIKTSLPNINIIVTGGNDTFHQQLNYNSRHKAGNSVDFVLLPATSPNVANVKKILQGFAAGGNGFVRFLDEYGDPTAKATGQHFHLSYGQGTEGNAELNASIALAQNNQIETYIV